ncbi:MAG: biotin transporter BioY [Ignavibacteria bacterium]|nr:biotin transporter BioY [Ignavibacteria bacterium]
MNKATTVMSVPLSMQKILDKKIHLVISFVVLCSLASKVVIPATPVPFTLQTLAVLLTGAILGARYGAYSIGIYLALGFVGLPVLAPVADGTFGMLSMFGPTGGYLLAFPLGAYIAGSIIEKRSTVPYVFAAFLIGEVVIITLGVLYLNTFFLHNLSQSFAIGASLFSGWTLAKVIAGTGITLGLKRFRK